MNDMRFLIVTPAKRGSTKGNRITAERWADILRTLGHDVTIASSYRQGDYDALIALHARRSAPSVLSFHSRMPGRPIVVAMTGTDLHHDLGRKPIVDSTLRRADRILLLEPEGKKKLVAAYRKKSIVIFQSAVPLASAPAPLTRWFEVSVLGHLRPVKDPFRAAYAARLLPGESRIRVVHFGEALSADMQRRAELETARNARYRWYGNLPRGQALRRLARSRVTVLSSRDEGGSSVISEAIVNNVPVLASRNDAAIGMLGADYPGLFEFGATEELAQLMLRVERESGFREQLVSAGNKLKARFSVQAETNAWAALIKSLSLKRKLM